jgi:hypothetical protein
METIMKYMLLIYDDETNWMNMPPAQLKKMYAEYGKFSDELATSGAMVGGSELAPIATASTVRVRKGKVITTDGPFAETKEQLGGYYMIDVANLDEAIKWASKIPSALSGSIEIRPLAAGEAPA